MSLHNREWLSRKEAASHLIALGYTVTPKTLSRLASVGKGPPYRITLDHITSYNRRELEAWAKASTKEITADELRKKRAVIEKRRKARNAELVKASTGGALAAASKTSGL